jgi:hypothetical protein
METMAPHLRARVEIDMRTWPHFDAGRGQAQITRETGLDRRAVRDSQERWYGGNLWRTVRQRIG